MERFDDQQPAESREHELAERGRALVAAAAAETAAPAALRERIEQERRRTAPGRRRRTVALLGGLAGAGVAALAAMAILIVDAGREPSVPAIAQLAARGLTLPAPGAERSNPALLDEENGGVPFPAWDDLRWRATGARRDEIDGRIAETVFYANRRGVVAAYTILGGEAIPPAEASRPVTVRGTKLWVLRRDRRTIVSWERGGRTCVLSAPASVPERRLLALAAWDARGRVPF